MLFEISVSVGCAATVYLAPQVLRYTRSAELARRLRRERLLILTYDDGPSPTLTQKVLDLLAAHDAKATFFMTGWRAAKYPEIADRVFREGHECGCHSYEHLNAWKTWPWLAVRDINRGFKSLGEWVSPAGPYRPPNGRITLLTWLALLHRRCPIWWWTLDSSDSRPIRREPHVVVDQVARAGGAAVLMHDLSFGPDHDAFVLETTALLLNLAKRKAIQVRPFRDLDLRNAAM